MGRRNRVELRRGGRELQPRVAGPRPVLGRSKRQPRGVKDRKMGALDHKPPCVQQRRPVDAMYFPDSRILSAPLKSLNVLLKPIPVRKPFHNQFGQPAIMARNLPQTVCKQVQL